MSDIYSDWSPDTYDAYDTPLDNIDANSAFSESELSDQPFQSSVPGASPTPNGNTLGNLFGSLFGTDTTGRLTPSNLGTGLTNLANTLAHNFINPNQSPGTSATAGNNTGPGGIPTTTWLLIGGAVLLAVILLRK